MYMHQYDVTANSKSQQQRSYDLLSYRRDLCLTKIVNVCNMLYKIKRVTNQ